MHSVAFEEFEDGAARDDAPPELVPYTQVETERVAGFEQGYQAGWDDALKAATEDQNRIASDFARAMQEVSFTFHEARAHVIQSMEPMLAEILTTLLPALVTETLGPRILEELRPLIEDSADTPVELVVAPVSRPAIERSLTELSAAAIRLTEEASLAEGQVHIRLGRTEKQIDLSGALERISEAIRSLYAINERTLKHG